MTPGERGDSANPEPTTPLNQVATNLRSERVHPVETLFRAQPFGEGELHPPSVEVALEVEEVRLDDNRATPVEGRAHSHIRNGGVHRAGFAPSVEKTHPAGVYPWRRKDLVGRIDIRRGKTEFTTSVVTVNDLAPHGEGVSQKTLGFLDLTLENEFSNPSRVHIATPDRNFRNDGHGETETGSSVGKQSHRTLAVATVMKVIPHVDLSGANSSVDKFLYEGLWAHRREFSVERLDDGHVHTHFLEALEFLIKTHEHRRGLGGLKNDPGVRVEGVNDGLPSPLNGTLDDPFHDRSVSPVKAVKVPDRQNGFA